MSSELQRWARPSSVPVSPRHQKHHQRDVQKVVNDARLTSLRVDAEAALASRIMERATDLDGYRKRLADGDPVLDAVLARIEVNFVDKAARLQRDMGSEWLG